MTCREWAAPGGPRSRWSRGMEGCWLLDGRGGRSAGVTAGAFSAALRSPPMRARELRQPCGADQQHRPAPGAARSWIQRFRSASAASYSARASSSLRWALSIFSGLPLARACLSSPSRSATLFCSRARRLRAGSAGGYRCSAPWLRPARGAGRLPGGCCRGPGPARCRFRSDRTWRRACGRAVGCRAGPVASRARAAAVMSVGNRARMRKTPG